MMRQYTYKVYGVYELPRKKDKPLPLTKNVKRMTDVHEHLDPIEERMINNRDAAIQLREEFNRLVELQITHAAWTREVNDTLERIQPILEALEVPQEKLKTTLDRARNTYRKRNRATTTTAA
jgi:hypothetical protein